MLMDIYLSPTCFTNRHLFSGQTLKPKVPFPQNALCPPADDTPLPTLIAHRFVILALLLVSLFFSYSVALPAGEKSCCLLSSQAQLGDNNAPLIHASHRLSARLWCEGHQGVLVDTCGRPIPNYTDLLC